ncbi:putative carbonic anhydrase 3 [Daphnia carinata]|uniref:putative carbonic anhydrase 3 n=1 Tax=Daphnia carinata TaxID=120202 RepID=UPI00257FE027|nr:putative carbonic anhydrase 3 [Daphnia carinata]
MHSSLRFIFTLMFYVFDRRAMAAGLKALPLIGPNITINSSVAGNTWNYGESVEWPIHIAPCGGKHQSPININPHKALVVNYPKLSFGFYDKVFPETVTNNGHTVTLQIGKREGKDYLPYIENGGLSDRYIFYQLHFHWGSKSNKGSEHRIANKRYPAELHMVHFSQKYDNFTEASKHPDGLAVLAVLIEMEKRDNIAFRHIEHFDEITRPSANRGNSSVSNLSNPVALEDLIPDNPLTFYRYNGSLTTPLCNEAVIWTVFDTPIALSERQMNEFRELFDEEGHHLTDNFRPVQSIHDRLVTYRNNKTIFN